jgi:hypothetical protein
LTSERAFDALRDIKCTQSAIWDGRFFSKRTELGWSARVPKLHFSCRLAVQMMHFGIAGRRIPGTGVPERVI